tara:strand:+ start:311 stop:511 length:201 start_codon:yes stop_codon:yes gene_type:complete
MEKKGDNDLEKIIETTKLQVRFLNEQLEYAGTRIRDLEEINKKHQDLNAELRQEIKNVRKALTRIP